MARARPGGHHPVLLASGPRAWRDQDQPQEDHRRRDRLAVPERDQARAEDVSRRRPAWMGGRPMPLMHSRRDFRVTLSAVGAAGLLGCGGALADEGPPETTTIRLRRDPSICVAPWYI